MCPEDDNNLAVANIIGQSSGGGSPTTVAASSESKHTVSGHFARAHIANAVNLGLSHSALLHEAKLSESLLYKAKSRIAPQQLAAIFRLVWRDCDDELMGMAAAPLRYGVFALIAERMILCDELGAALREACRFYDLITDSVSFRLTQGERDSSLSVCLKAPERDPDHLLCEFLLLVWHRFASWLVGRVIPLHTVQFDFPRPAHWQEYPLLFPAPCRFEQRENALTWPVEVLSLPIRRSKEQLRSHLRHAPLPWFRKPRFHESVSERVSMLLEQCLEDNIATLEEIAGQLHMTERTLRRKMLDEGTSYRNLKDNIRRDRAIHLLSQDGIPISAVGRRCGYIEATAFMRAFKIWTGMSAGEYRRKMRVRDSQVRSE